MDAETERMIMESGFIPTEEFKTIFEQKKDIELEEIEEIINAEVL